MSIQPAESSQYLTANREWLASLHGTDQTDTITLDLPLFTEGVHYQCGECCDPYGLTAFARAIPSPKDFLLTQRIFPTSVLREVKWRVEAGIHGRPGGKRTWGPPAHAALRRLTTTIHHPSSPSCG